MWILDGPVRCLKLCLTWTWTDGSAHIEAIENYLSYSELFHSKVTFKAKCLLHYLGHSAFCYFHRNFLLSFLPFHHGL